MERIQQLTKPELQTEVRFNRPLNAFDQCMLSINEIQQRDGNPGFETLSVLWLEKPLGRSQLRRALEHLAERHPILAARLHRRWWGEWYWETQPNAQIPLEEYSLPSNSESDVFGFAGEILSQRRDLRQDAPVDFLLIQLNDGSGILAMHTNHALMDHQSIELVLRELSQILKGEVNYEPTEPTDLVATYRQRFSRSTRRRAFRKIFPDLIWDRWSRRRFWPRQMPQHKHRPTAAPAEMRVLTKKLSLEATRSLECFSRSSGQLRSLSMTVLCSAFAGFAKTIADPRQDDLFRAGIGVELARQHPETFHPQNASSVIRLSVTRSQVANRQACVEQLNQQFFEVLKNQTDLGIVEANSRFHRIYPLIRRVSGQTIRNTYSFFYGYFEVPRELSRDFGGVPLRHVQSIGPAWSPPGLTLLAVKFRGQIELILTYIPSIIPDVQAQRLLNSIFDGLNETPTTVQ